MAMSTKKTLHEANDGCNSLNQYADYRGIFLIDDMEKFVCALARWKNSAQTIKMHSNCRDFSFCY